MKNNQLFFFLITFILGSEYWVDIYVQKTHEKIAYFNN